MKVRVLGHGDVKHARIPHLVHMFAAGEPVFRDISRRSFRIASVVVGLARLARIRQLFDVSLRGQDGLHGLRRCDDLVRVYSCLGLKDTLQTSEPRCGKNQFRIELFACKGYRSACNREMILQRYMSAMPFTKAMSRGRIMMNRLAQTPCFPAAWSFSGLRHLYVFRVTRRSRLLAMLCRSLGRPTLIGVSLIYSQSFYGSKKTCLG